MDAGGDGKGSEQPAAGMETCSLGPAWETWPELSLRAVDCPTPGSLPSPLPPLSSWKANPALYPLAEAMDAARQVLGHGSALHGLNAHLLQGLGKPAGDRAEGDRSCSVRTQNLPRASSGPSCAHLMRSWFPSSFPRCSRPRVQAKMLAMGLVLVGRPWGQGSQRSQEPSRQQGGHLNAADRSRPILPALRASGPWAPGVATLPTLTFWCSR